MDQLNRAADHVGVAQVVALPEFVAEDDDGLSVLAERSIGGHQPAAHQSFCAPVIRVIWGEIGGPDIFGEIAVGGGEIPVVHAGDALDGLGLAELFQLGTVEPGVAIVAGCVEHAGFHEAIGAGVREGIDQNGVNDTEDGTCGGNAES